MIPKECKRLAEVDFPIAKVSRSSLLENARRGSHPKGLHLWWARRPLSACRSILLALLLPDPADPHCPKSLIDKMKQALLNAPRRPRRWESDSMTPEGLRRIILEFIAEFSHPENSQQPEYIRCARDLVATLSTGERPVVYDSFAGGGSIPLEALRLGCDAIGSDLNPLACLILRTELELLPRHGEDLVDQLDEAGKIIDARFRARIQQYFSESSPRKTTMAYFWARQATCESPNCGVTFPLASAFWLCKKKGHERALKMSGGTDGSDLACEVFCPTSGAEVPHATVTNGRARCPRCGTVLTNERLRSQLAKDRGGIERAKLLAKVTQDSTTGRKSYCKATLQDIKAAEGAALQLCQIEKKANEASLPPIPSEPIHRSELRRISAPLYGCVNWEDLFLPRQRLSLHFLIEEIRKYIVETGKNSLLPLLALSFGKIVRHWNSNARWHTKSENVAGAFGRQAIPMAYFFPEQSPLSSSGAGSWIDAVKTVASSARAVVGLGNAGQSFRADACDVPLPSESVNVWFTDPPYYDAVAYAHLADFFYVWIRRLIPDDPLFTTALIDKAQECVVDRPHSQSPSQKGADWFETKMGQAMADGRRVLAEDGVASVVFAHKTTEGWEAIIGAMLKAKWVITASWPISTERGARLNARDNASLATSVHLICRPRPEDAQVGDWAEVLRELPNRVGNWMERLQREGIRGADLVFACIGPALELFSRYSKVVDPEEREIPLGGDPEAAEPHKRGYLSYVWETVGRMALEQVLGTEEAHARNGVAGALEEDARLTALFLWTLQSTNGNGEGKNKKVKGKSAAKENGEIEEIDEDLDEGAPKGRVKGYSLVFDVARRFAQPLGIDLPKWENRIIKTEKGVVRLLPVSERAKQLFGEAGAKSAADWIEQEPVKSLQMKLFPELEKLNPPKIRARGRGKIAIDPSGIDSDSMRQATTLDRVHAAMLLQAGGQTNALRSLIKSEQDRSPDFLRLANALSALYPKVSEEKRLLDAMLLAVSR
jgi:putative DNA methylase